MELKLNTILMLMEKRTGSYEIILKAIEGMSLLFYMILTEECKFTLEEVKDYFNRDF